MVFKNGFDSTTPTGRPGYTPSSAFLMVIETALAGPTSLVYSTHIDGSTITSDAAITNEAMDVAVDSAGNAILVGKTNTTNFRLKNALQADSKGGLMHAFIAKINPNAKGEDSLLWSTYFGAYSTTAESVAVDDNNNIYLVGSTYGRASLPITYTKFGTCALNSA
ncbi:hypothetical protein EON83_13595 [bacterium]|nr:MAG: hypothetical protein EON83_13595 [bacterium]